MFLSLFPGHPEPFLPVILSLSKDLSLYPCHSEEPRLYRGDEEFQVRDNTTRLPRPDYIGTRNDGLNFENLNFDIV
jgi:hypothetical protein